MYRRYLLFLSLILWLSGMMLAESAPRLCSVGLVVNTGGTFGTQDKSLHVGFSCFVATSLDQFSVEASATYSLAYNYQKFGIGKLGRGGTRRSSLFAWQIQPAYGDNTSFLALDSGSSMPRPDNRDGGWSVGFIIGQRYNTLPSKLKEFENLQGRFGLFAAAGDYRVKIDYLNDVRTYFPLIVLGDGQDLGPTAFLSVGWDKITEDAIYSGGWVIIDMFTPPSNKAMGKVDDGPKLYSLPQEHPRQQKAHYGVYSIRSNYPKLYHGKTYLFCGYRRPHTQVLLKMGLDSAKWGAFTQDLIHNNGLLKQRLFPWNPDKTLSWYFEFSATGVLQYDRQYQP